jgi:hypothetical protein
MGRALPRRSRKTAEARLGNLWKFLACRILTTSNYRLVSQFSHAAKQPSQSAGEAEGLARSWGGGRNAVSARRNGTAPNAHRAFPGGFLNPAR